jgi:hypothetical protein
MMNEGGLDWIGDGRSFFIAIHDSYVPSVAVLSSLRSISINIEPGLLPGIATHFSRRKDKAPSGHSWSVARGGGQWGFDR